MTNKAKHLIVRFLSMFLLVAIVFGLIPANIARTASATAGPIQEPSMKNHEVPGSPSDISPPSTITLEQKILYGNAENDDATNYPSPNMGWPVNRYSIRMSDGTNDDIRGYCIDWRKKLDRNTMIGMTWENPVDARTSSETFSSEVFRILDYYFYQVQLHDQAHEKFPSAYGCSDYTDGRIKENPGYEGMWRLYDINIYNAMVQALLWTGRDKGENFKPLTANFDDAVKEFKACLAGTPEADHAEEWFEEVRNALLYDGNEHQIPQYRYYFYSLAPGQGPYVDQTQRILIPLLPPPDDTPHKVYVKARKVTEDGTPLANATFQAYLDASCTEEWAVGQPFKSGADGWAVSGPITRDDENPVSIWVKEISTPSDEYTLDPNTYEIIANPNENNTPETATTTDQAVFVNKTNHRDPKGVVFKVDRYTGERVGPATFTFTGNGLNEQPFESDETGMLILQWWEPSGENYIAPGTYTVKESVPPPGYYGTDEVQTLTLTYDAETKITTQSGPISFENVKKKKITLLKVDESGNPLPGAKFRILLDGEVLFEEKETGPDGKIVLEDVQCGLYVFEETAAPEGYSVPLENYACVNVTEDTTISDFNLTMRNYELPDIHIFKYEHGKIEPLPGAVFQVMIDDHDLGNSEPTGVSGEIIFKGKNLSQYIDPKKDTHTVRVREVQAPAGFDIDDPSWKVETFRTGQNALKIVFTDTKHPEIIIRKYKEGTTQKLEGAEFKVVIDGKTLNTYTTGPEGEIHITSDEYSAIWDGNAETHSVTVTETKAPAGYLKAAPDTQKLKMYKGQKLLEFAFYDKPYSDILIVKRDKETQEPPSGRDLRY